MPIRRQRDRPKSLYPWGKEPFATFIFKYRTRGKLVSLDRLIVISTNTLQDDLRKEWILPRSPSPPALEDRNIDDLTHEEALELLRRQRGQRGSAARVKKEVKAEPRNARAAGNNGRARRSTALEVLDLTDD